MVIHRKSVCRIVVASLFLITVNGISLTEISQDGSTVLSSILPPTASAIAPDSAIPTLSAIAPASPFNGLVFENFPFKPMAQALGYFSVALGICNSIPQLIHSYKTKSAAGVSLDSLLLGFSANVLMTYGTFVTGDQLFIIKLACVWGIVNNIIVTGQACYYQDAPVVQFFRRRWQALKRRRQEIDHDAIRSLLESVEINAVQNHGPFLSVHTIVLSCLIISIPLIASIVSFYLLHLTFTESYKYAGTLASWVASGVGAAAPVPQFLKLCGEKNFHGISPYPLIIVSFAQSLFGTSLVMSWLSGISKAETAGTALLNFSKTTMAMAFCNFFLAGFNVAIVNQVLPAPSSTTYSFQQKIKQIFTWFKPVRCDSQDLV